MAIRARSSSVTTGSVDDPMFSATHRGVEKRISLTPCDNTAAIGCVNRSPLDRRIECSL